MVTTTLHSDDPEMTTPTHSSKIECVFFLITIREKLFMSEVKLLALFHQNIFHHKSVHGQALF